jgi:pyruvate-ferredoxin/flavodoxin oxidoreductase
MRGLESLSGRRHDVIERSAGSDAAAMIVAAGVLGESLLGEVDRLRALGHDVGVVKVTALRPFPGPRIVRALGRSLAVTVLEGVDEPLAQSNPLTREVKAAFADALTWSPGYPGVGRIPRVTSGVVGLGGHELDALDFDAIVRNMLEGERGKRLFAFGADADLSLPLSLAGTGPSAAPSGFVMRGVVRDLATAVACSELCASVLGSALALRVRATVRAPGASGAARFEVVASRERPRGVHTPHTVRLVVLDYVAVLLGGNPLARLAQGGIVALPTHHRTPEALWASLPPYVKAIVFDRHGRVVGWPTGDASPDDVATPSAQGADGARWLTAAAFAGVALAGLGKPAAGEASRPRFVIDASLVAREVAIAIRMAVRKDALPAEVAASMAERGGELARRAFEAHVEVPRATIERDTDGVDMGRHDERAALR